MPSCALHRKSFVVPAFAVCLLAIGSCAAFASSGQQYVALRNKRHCDRKLTYKIVQEEASNYVGKVVEIRGQVSGTMESANGLSIMLSPNSADAVTLDIPKSETVTLRDYATPMLRVLAKVGEGSNGSSVEWEVLAIAHDSEVKTVEATEAAKAARRAARSGTVYGRWPQSVTGSQRALLASRGSMTAAPMGMDVQRMAEFYAQNLPPRARPLFAPYFNYIAQQNHRLTADMVGLITASLLRFADGNNIDPRLVVAMIIAESGFDPNSTSRSGAAGLGQLMPETARSLGVDNPYDPVKNLNGSISYLCSRLDSFGYRFPDGSVSFDHAALALAAYNAGMGAVKKYKGIPPYRETQAYVNRVIRLYQKLRGEG